MTIIADTKLNGLVARRSYGDADFASTEDFFRAVADEASKLLGVKMVAKRAKSEWLLAGFWRIESVDTGRGIDIYFDGDDNKALRLYNEYGAVGFVIEEL